MSTKSMSNRLIVSFIALIAASSTTGCFPLFKTQKDVYNVEQRYPIAVDTDTASLTVPVSGQTLAPQSARDVRAFLAVYKARGHGPLTIARPAGSSGEKNARQLADEVARLAAGNGIDPTDLVLQSYNVPAGEPNAPVLVSFTRFVASTAPCGDWSHNAGTSLRNTEMPNFGCSTQSNFAAALEDPHDLVAPRGMASADAERRSTVIGKYRKGESTITDRKDSEKADVSKVGGGG